MPSFSDSEHLPNPNSNDNSAAERHYWNRQIIVQWAMVWVALLTWAAVSAYTFWAWRQVQIMDKTLVATERPWVSVEANLVGALTFDQNGGHVTVKFALENWGKSPANGVGIWGFFVSPSNTDDALKTQESWCAGRRKAVGHLLHYTKLGYSLFPTGKHETTIGFQLNQAEIINAEIAYTKMGGEKANFILPQIVGCVIYNYGEHTFDTDFRYELGIAYPPATVQLPNLRFETSSSGNEAH